MIERHFDRTKPYRYVMYGRMSDEKQNPRSPDQQFNEIAREISRQNLPWKLLKDYRDDAISGRLVRARPGLQELLREIRTQTVRPDLVLIDTQMRFGRADKLKDIRRDLYHHHGIYILTADSHFHDPNTPAGRVLSAFDEIRATEDNRTKAHDVLRGKRDQVLRKFWPGGPPPRGFKLQRQFIDVNGSPEYQGSILVHEPEWLWIARMIFERADETGDGQVRLAKFVNAHPDVPKKLLPISGSTIGHMLNNELYKGDFHFPKLATDIIDDVRVRERNGENEITIVHGFCEPVVTAELWDRVHAVRNTRRSPIRSDDYRNRDDEKLIKPLLSGISIKNLLSGLTRCGHCGVAMRPQGPSATKDPTGKYVYFACPRSKEGICVNKQTIPKNWLVQVVVELIKSSLFGNL